MKKLINPTANYRWIESTQAFFATVVTVMICITLSGCKKDSLGETSGTITYEDEVYTVSIGAIESYNENTTVELVGNLKSEIVVHQGRFEFRIGMRIIADGKTFEYTSILIGEGSHTFNFSTNKHPSKIIVYSNDAKNSTLTFDGKSKTLIK